MSLNYKYIPFEMSVSLGGYPAMSVVDKFGENPQIDTGTTPEDIWEGGGLYNYDADGTAPIERVVSNNAADTGNLNVQGLDIDGNMVSQTVTLNGTTPVLLPTPLWRCFRMINVGTADLVGTVYAYIGTTAPTAVPPATADSQTRAIINNGNNQTLMSLYTIPAGKVGFLYRGELGMSRAQTTGAVQLSYYSRRYGGVFTVKKRVDVTNQGSSIFQDIRSFPDTIPALTDIRLTVEDVSSNGAGVFGTFDILLVDQDEFPTDYLQNIGQPGV